MSGLRFCFFTTFYPPFNFGGDGIGIRRLAHGLARRGHHVTVVHDADAYSLLSEGPDPQPLEEPEGVEVVSLRSRFGGLSMLLTHQVGAPLMHGGRIRRLLQDGQFDVIVYHNISLVGGPALIACGGDAVRLYMAHEHWLVCPMHVLWRHGRELCTGRECLRCTLRHRRPPQLYRYTGMMDRHLEEVDAFVAMSAFSRDKHREFGFQFPMEVVPYFLPDPDGREDAVTAHELASGGGDGRDGEHWSAQDTSPHTRPYFLFVGRLEEIKGLQDVIPVFSDFPDADLLIAGDGEFRTALEEMASGLGNVHFLGRLGLEDLQRAYRHSLALIVPSVCYETFGIILIEAFSQKTPVIARRLGPFPEIVERADAGALFDSREDLRAAMRKMIDDPAWRDARAGNGYRAFREEWTESAVIPRFLDVVRRAAGRRGSSRIADKLSAVEAT